MCPPIIRLLLPHAYPHNVICTQVIGPTTHIACSLAPSKLPPSPPPSLPTHRLTVSSRLITPLPAALSLCGRVSRYCCRIYPGFERDSRLPDKHFHVRKSRGDPQETLRLFFSIRWPFPVGLARRCESTLRLIVRPSLSHAFPHQTQRKLSNNMLLAVNPNQGLKGLNSGWQVLLSPSSCPSMVLPADA